jgi:predicted Holliday junction resolvase-like endonuclease
MILSIVLFLVIIFQTVQIDDLQNSYNNAKKQVTNLTNQNNKQQTEITNQKGQNNKQQTEITNLKELVPQKYRVTANRAKLYYKNCDKKNVPIDCIYHYDNIVNIYVIENGYGLSKSGWIIMSDLTKQ